MKNPDQILRWSYPLAREWVIKNLVPLGINSSRKFGSYKKSGKYLPTHFPKSPDDYFRHRNTWKGWGDFFGYPDHRPSKKYVDYQRASIVTKQANIKNSSDYKKWKDRPYILPARPDQYYKDQWTGWKEFLGSNYKIQTKRYSKLSEEDVRIIKHQLKMGISGAFLAKYFRVSEMQISRIKHGENWKEITV